MTGSTFEIVNGPNTRSGRPFALRRTTVDHDVGRGPLSPCESSVTIATASADDLGAKLRQTCWSVDERGTQIGTTVRAESSPTIQQQFPVANAHHGQAASR